MHPHYVHNELFRCFTVGGSVLTGPRQAVKTLWVLITRSLFIGTFPPLMLDSKAL